MHAYTQTPVAYGQRCDGYVWQPTHCMIDFIILEKSQKTPLSSFAKISRVRCHWWWIGCDAYWTTLRWYTYYWFDSFPPSAAFQATTTSEKQISFHGQADRQQYTATQTFSSTYFLFILSLLAIDYSVSIMQRRVVSHWFVWHLTDEQNKAHRFIFHIFVCVCVLSMCCASVFLLSFTLIKQLNTLFNRLAIHRHRDARTHTHFTYSHSV